MITSGGARDLRRSRIACQCAVWRHAVSSTHAPIGTIRPVSSANVDEVVGPEQPALGVVPPHQRLEADHPAGAEVDDRLVVDDELVAFERAVQVGAGAQRRHGRAVAVGLEHDRPGAAVVLGLVHRGVGVAEQRLGGRRPRCRDTAMPMLAVTNTSSVLSVIGSATAASSRSASRRHRLDAREVVAEHHELVAAEAGEHVAGPNRVPEPLRDGDERARRRARARGCR